jgi:ATP-dependent protease ClpP protease subunit
MHTYKSGEKSLDSEYHTLFIEEKKEQRELIDWEQKLYKITPKYKQYSVYIDSFHETKKGLHSVFNELRKADDEDTLELRISSGGGSVLEGQQFFNIIIEKFRERTTTYLDNHGYSMGALLFCMSHKRVIYPYSDIMFHDYSQGVYGKGGNVQSKVKHSAQSLKNFFHDLIVDRRFLSEKEFQHMLLGHDFWMDAEEMCKRGIATHVIVGKHQIIAKEYLKQLKKEKKAQKKAAKKKKNEALQTNKNKEKVVEEEGEPTKGKKSKKATKKKKDRKKKD